MRHFAAGEIPKQHYGGESLTALAADFSGGTADGKQNKDEQHPFYGDCRGTRFNSKANGAVRHQKYAGVSAENGG
jgi:hypothetical protein